MVKELKVESIIREGLGIISLNRVSKLNVLDEDMIDQLEFILNNFKEDASVAKVVIRGNGPKAFCAGGDVVSLLKGIDKGREIDFFFKKEYRVDQLLHEFPKQVTTLAHGVVFGGGFGLFSGGSERLCFEDALFSMPEVTIGFFPDVGSSFFLGRAPFRWRILMGMCGARIDAHWAKLLGLTDQVFATKEKGHILPLLNKDTSLLEKLNLETPPNRLAEFKEVDLEISAIETMDSCEDFHAWAELTLTHTKSPFLKSSLTTYFAGSRLSSAVAWHLFNWSKSKGLAECIAMDLELAKLFGVHYDFKEGVRALLIDKDKSPKFRFSNYSSMNKSDLAPFLSLF